ncbi:MAG: hypothetical protein ACFFAN_05280 [Promethearchaeota archaeon]
MKKNNKTIIILIIGFLVVFTIFAQTTFNKSTIKKESTTQNVNNPNHDGENIEPKLSQTDHQEQFYDWNDGNNMMIESDTGDFNETFVAIESGSEHFYVDSEIQNQYGANIYMDGTGTLRGGNYGIESVKENDDIITTLYGAQLDAGGTLLDIPFELCQSNNSLLFYTNTPPLAPPALYNSSIKAEKNAVGNYLDNFSICTYEADGDIDLVEKIDYVYNREDGYDLQYNLTKLYPLYYLEYCKVHLDYNEDLNQYKWHETNLDHYIVNESGVYESDDMIDYSLVLEWNNPSLTFYGKSLINITSANSSIVINYNNVYELLFTKRGTEEVSLMFTGLHKYVTMPGGHIFVANTSFFWYLDYLTLFSGYGDSYALLTFLLWDIVDVLYSFTWPLFELEVTFLITSVIIEWDWISIEIWLVENMYLHWIVIFHWLFWSFKVQYWCILSSRIFTDYVVWIQYSRILKPDLIYIYYVPTYVMPNMLVVNIIDSVYTESNFNITFTVKDCFGFLLDVSKINVFWNGDNESSGLTYVSTGTYNISLPAILVDPGDPGKLLNITASEYGYADGNLLTQIAVEDSDNEEPPPKKLVINIIKSVYSENSFEFVVEVTNCSGDLELGTILEGKWNGIDLTGENITDNFDGTFNLTLTPILVSPDADPIWLNLTATKTGYVKGVLNTEIAVDPPTVDKDGNGGNGGDDGDDEDDGDGGGGGDKNGDGGVGGGATQILIPIIIGVGAVSIGAGTGVLIFLIKVYLPKKKRLMPQKRKVAVKKEKKVAAEEKEIAEKKLAVEKKELAEEKKEK